MFRISTIVRFLLFDKKAIRQIANTPGAVWPGLLFVLSAGFAREYDGEYLIAEPWHLLIPVAASLIGCASMTLLVWWLAQRRETCEISYGTIFRSFLNLYWMTAPLAWLYAIPFERFLSPANATTANLTLLGIVAVWRVALMVRSVQVLFDARWFAALVPVMLFSDVLAMLALYLMPAPIFLIMGGVRLSESEDILLSFRLTVGLAVYGTFLFWLISYLILLVVSNKGSWEWFRKADPAREPVAISSRVWQVSIASIIVWIPALVFTQPEQRLRYQAERMIHAGDYDGAANLSNEHDESDFPPHWDPPPRPAYGETRPFMVDAFTGLLKANAAAWLVSHYERKLQNESGDYWFHMHVLRYSDDELEKWVELVAEIENNEKFMEHFRGMKDGLYREDLSERRREIYKRMVEIGLAAESE